MKTLLIPAALALLAVSCRSTPPESPAADRREPTAVTTMIVKAQQLPRTLEAGGVVRAAASATLASRTVATVTAVRVKAGDRVRAGDVLVQLDSRDLAARQQQAADSVMALTHASNAAAADRQAAEASLALARTSHDRIAGLFARESATAQERDEAVAALRAAEARAAAAAARELELGATLAGARQAGTAADVATSFASIRAPFAGVVVERLADPGDLASPGVPLLRVDDTSRFRLDATVDEARVGGITPGSPVSVVIDENHEPIRGTVSEISRATAAGAHAFTVKIALPPAASLRSGQFGRALFAVASREGIAVPRAAIVPQGQLSTVWVVADGRARMRVIAPGDAATADLVEVVGGLVTGEQVVVSPPPQLHDGDRVRTTGGTR